MTLNPNRGIALGNGLAGVSDGILNIPTGVTLTYGGLLASNGASSGQLVVQGGGTLTWGSTAANSYTGGTIINNSTVSWGALTGGGGEFGAGTVETQGTVTINTGALYLPDSPIMSFTLTPVPIPPSSPAAAIRARRPASGASRSRAAAICTSSLVRPRRSNSWVI